MRSDMATTRRQRGPARDGDMVWIAPRHKKLLKNKPRAGSGNGLEEVALVAKSTVYAAFRWDAGSTRPPRTDPNMRY